MLKDILGIEIDNVHFNSKLIKPNGLFIPIKGEKQDGHHYLEDAINNGAIATLWEKNTPIPNHLQQRVTYFLVDDTLNAFQELANKYRKIVNPIVVGITGSNGKTTTKELLYTILSEKFSVHKNSGNFNNHLGVPLTLLSMPINTEVCIVEMGMNHLGEIDLLSKIAEPNYSIILNIGESHIGLLGSRENIAIAKKEILSGMLDKRNIVFDGDEPLLNDLTGHKILESDIKNINLSSDHITFNLDGVTFRIPTLGVHNVKNSSFAIKIGRLLNIDTVSIQNGLLKFKNAPLRLEYKELLSNSFLLDCYNASLTSMKAAVDTLSSINTDKNKIAILGDIFELGEESQSIHKNILELANEYPGLNFWFIGQSMLAAAENINRKENALIFNSKEDLYSFINQNTEILKDNYFLLKASRGMKFENIYQEFTHLKNEQKIREKM